MTSGTTGNIGSRTLTPGPGTWTNISANATNFVQGPPNYLQGAINGSSIHRTNQDAPSLNDEVEADVYVTALASARVGIGLGATGTLAGANRTWYFFTIDSASPYDFYLNKFDETNAIDARLAQVSQASSVPLSLNTHYTFKLRREDNGNGTVQLIGSVNGTQIFSVTDTAPLPAGRMAIRLSNGGRIYSASHSYRT